MEKKLEKIEQKMLHKHHEPTKQIQRISSGPPNITRPKFDKGILQQKTDTNGIITAWDEQLVAKFHPGQFNV